MDMRAKAIESFLDTVWPWVGRLCTDAHVTGTAADQTAFTAACLLLAEVSDSAGLTGEQAVEMVRQALPGMMARVAARKAEQ